MTKLMARVLVMALALVIPLAGCFAPVVEGAHETYDYSKRSSLEPKAAAGDAQAQYELGESYCCVVTGEATTSASVYDNNKATRWLCQSARQNYGPAQYKLARIYSGNLVEGIRILKRGAALLSDQKVDRPLALMWARIAAANGVEDAGELRDDLQKDATAEDLERTDALAAKWRSAPCEWQDVFAEQ
jgi:TPR repeat protein